MKRTALLIMSFVMCAALCLTGCKKEDPELTESGNEATLDDFVGTYDVVITEAGTDYNATMVIEKVSASVFDFTIAESDYVARITYTTTDANLQNKEWFPQLSSPNCYAYAKGGYLTFIDKEANFIFAYAMAYQQKGKTASFDAQYKLLTNIQFKATRK